MNQVLRVGSFSIVLVDSSIPGRAEGRLDPETLTWLDETLSEAPGQAFVGMHHQASTLHSPCAWTASRCATPTIWPTCSSRHQRGRGHLRARHTAAATTFAGLPLLVGPGVVSTG